MSLQCLKKELSYEVDVLHSDKYKCLLQVETIIFDGVGQACPNYPGKFAISLLLMYNSNMFVLLIVMKNPYNIWVDSVTMDKGFVQQVVNTVKGFHFCFHFNMVAEAKTVQSG